MGTKTAGMAKFRRIEIRSMRSTDCRGATSQQPEVTQKRGSCSIFQSVANVLASSSCLIKLYKCGGFKQQEFILLVSSGQSIKNPGVSELYSP